jgi:Xaa-Pro aminopeptidase
MILTANSVSSGYELNSELCSNEMERDTERIASISEALNAADLDLLICSLPTNVLLITGYWPVVGTSLAIVTREGRVIILAPEDEEELAGRGSADELHTFKPGSLTQLNATIDAVRRPMDLIARNFPAASRVGYESGDSFTGCSYSAMHIYGSAIVDLLSSAFPTGQLLPANDLIAQLKARKTFIELRCIRAACAAAARAFEQGARLIRPGLREYEVASLFRDPLAARLTEDADCVRADGFVYCMSGHNSAKAYRAYAQSSRRKLEAGDFVLVHCNSYVDGFWTDITRTYCLGEPNERQREMYVAVLFASAAATDAIRPGIPARDIDQVVRDELARRGFGQSFVHSAGHGVGFAAIDHNARPCLHPKSGGHLQANMVFNVEPAIYSEKFGGLRHCNMIAVTDGRAEILTSFHSCLEELIRA